MVRPLEELKGLRVCVESRLTEDEILCVVRSPPHTPHSPVTVSIHCAKTILKS